MRIRQRHQRTGSVAAAKRGRPKGSGRLEAVGGFLRREVEGRPDMTMPELAERLRAVHGLHAAPAELSRFLKHRLGFTYKKISDRDRAAAQTGARRAVRLAIQTPAEDAP